MEQSLTVEGAEQRPWRKAVLAMTTVLMNLWAWPLMGLWTLGGTLLSPAVWAVLRLATRWPTARIVRLMIWLYGRGWLLIMSPFVRFRRQNLAPANVPHPCIFVINHLSFFDTYCMGLLPVANIAFAVRSWPFKKLFWYTAFMRLARYLEVEDLEWPQTLAQAQAVTAAGGSILFFPEGHRSRDGQLQRFYTGAFHLAIALNVPVVPLCIVGTDTLFPPGRKWLRPTPVTLRALPAVDPAPFIGDSGPMDLRKEVKDRMARELASMREDA